MECTDLDMAVARNMAVLESYSGGSVHVVAVVIVGWDRQTSRPKCSSQSSPAAKGLDQI